MTMFAVQSDEKHMDSPIWYHSGIQFIDKFKQMHFFDLLP